MRGKLLRFNRGNSKRSGEGGYSCIPDQKKSIQKQNNITSIASKDHPATGIRHSLHEDNIAHYHIKAVPPPHPEVLTPSFPLQNPDWRDHL